MTPNPITDPIREEAAASLSLPLPLPLLLLPPPLLPWTTPRPGEGLPS